MHVLLLFIALVLSSCNVREGFVKNPDFGNVSETRDKTAPTLIAGFAIRPIADRKLAPSQITHYPVMLGTNGIWDRLKVIGEISDVPHLNGIMSQSYTATLLRETNGTKEFKIEGQPTGPDKICISLNTEVGELNYLLYVNPGDFDENGMVGNADMNFSRNNLFGMIIAASPFALIAADTDNNGTINNADLNNVRNLLGFSLPDGEPICP